MLGKIVELVKLNDLLLRTTLEILAEIISTCRKLNISLPKYDELSYLLERLKNIVNQINAERIITFTKQCSICGKLNPEDAKYCAYCGTTLGVITRIRHDDKSPKDTTEPFMKDGKYQQFENQMKIFEYLQFL